MYTIQIYHKEWQFRQAAGTSRGVYHTRRVAYLCLTNSHSPERKGWGECAPLPALSVDDLPDYPAVLQSFAEQIQRRLNSGDARLSLSPEECAQLTPYPSMLFGLETMFRHYTRDTWALFDTPFSRGEAGIVINGLIWMNPYEDMLRQVETKMKQGYRCIKLKIGAIAFEDELSLLRHIRRHFAAHEIAIRVDANGAFSPEEALEKLERLAAFDLHSIEQPIRARQHEAMAALCSKTPLPIALDEELIGSYDNDAKGALLRMLKPQYIVLKPSLHGGWSGSQEWMEQAKAHGIGSWITSALETNIGLNAIAQWCATWQNTTPQGLGTGQLFTDNIPLPLEIRKDALWFNTTNAMLAVAL